MSNSANRYYAEGVIKELWMATKADTSNKEDAQNKEGTSKKGDVSETEVRFTLTPDKEYAIEAEYKGEKKTCAIFRADDFAKDIFDDNGNSGNKGVADLYAGDFTFSVPKGMSFDRLLLIKVNACHLRIYVEDKDSLADSDTLDEGKLNRKSPVQLSEIRLKQR